MGCSGLGAAYYFGLSDKLGPIRLPGVRFFLVIGQARAVSLAGCPILCGYRTSSGGLACWVSDSLRLSDKFGPIRLLVVRFFAVIGQAWADSLVGFPILCHSVGISMTIMSNAALACCFLGTRQVPFCNIVSFSQYRKKYPAALVITPRGRAFFLFSIVSSCRRKANVCRSLHPGARFQLPS